MFGARRCLVVCALVTCAGCPSPAEDEGGASATGESESSESSESGSSTATATTTTTTETSAGSETDTGGEDPPRPQRLVMTSDWRAQRLSLLDYAALRDGAATREDALWKEIDLGGHEPGPIEAELSPDGSLAVVAVGPGFFAGALGGLVNSGDVPEGGAVLVVEIDSGAVLAEIATAQYPLGVAITDDGAAAWTANYGGNGQSGMTMSHIDLLNPGLVEEFEIGPGPEQLDLRGELALINTASDGSVRLFDINDPLATLSAPAVVSGDPSWVLFMGPDDSRAIVINSVGPSGYSLLDISDPMSPMEIDEIEVLGIPYAAARGTVDTELVMSVLVGTEISVQRWDTLTSMLIDEIIVPSMGFPLGIVFVPEDELALIPIPGANVLAVVDFATGEQRELDWQDPSGPTYVAIE